MHTYSIRFVPATREMVVTEPVSHTVNRVILRTDNIEDIFDHIMVSNHERDMDIYNEFG